MAVGNVFFSKSKLIFPLEGTAYLFFSVLRFTEKGNLEVLLFTIQSKMRANNQKVYMPREGKLISDINKVKPINPSGPVRALTCFIASGSRS